MIKPLTVFSSIRILLENFMKSKENLIRWKFQYNSFTNYNEIDVKRYGKFYIVY